MKKVHENCRQYGTIRSVKHDDCDGRCDTTWVFVDLKDGGTQGFGGYVLNEHRKAWDEALCAAFGVGKLEDLVGKNCFALRCFPGWNEPIEGLETMDGRRVTATGFFRGRIDKIESRLERRREDHQREIAFLTRRVQEETAALARIDATFVDWEKP